MKLAVLKHVPAAALAVVGALAFVNGTAACGDDTSTVTPNTDSGPTDSGPKADTGADGAVGTLYDRLGKKAGIRSAIDAIVVEELKDPEIASYFFYQSAAPANLHPTPSQISACFTNLLAKEAGGPEAYPGVPADNEGFQCRSMQASHAKLGIPGSVFDKFVTIAAGVLTKANVAAADIGVIGGVLTGTKSAVAQDTVRDGGAFDAQGKDANEAP